MTNKIMRIRGNRQGRGGPTGETQLFQNADCQKATQSRR